jgi:hypothetical protein
VNATLDRRCPREGEVEAALDGRLDAAAEATALAHARDCLACAARERSLRSLREAARALPPAAPDADAARRMRAEVLAGALRRGRGPASPWAYAAAAAAALVVVGAAVALRRPSPAPAVDGIDLAGAGTLRPERGAVYRVERAGPDTRIGLTEGVIHLAVAHRRRGERFVIALGDAEVEVRGTRFLVDAHDGHLRRVRVTEGLVAVRRAGAAERLVAAGSTLEVTEAPPPGPAAATIAPLPAEAPSPEASPAPASAPRVEAARAAASAAASRDFRAGALAYNRGEHAEAAAALQRFLAAAPARDPRREDARYVLVLALDASRDEAADRAAREYLAEFPRGLRFAEVTVRLTRRLAARGACDAAARVALGMPENADAALRTQVVQALSRCPAAE